MISKDLSRWLLHSVCAYPEKYDQIAIWREPVMACAPADDRLQHLKKIRVPDHLLPEDLLPGAKTVMVLFENQALFDCMHTNFALSSV